MFGLYGSGATDLKREYCGLDLVKEGRWRYRPRKRLIGANGDRCGEDRFEPNVHFGMDPQKVAVVALQYSRVRRGIDSRQKRQFL